MKPRDKVDRYAIFSNIAARMKNYPRWKSQHLVSLDLKQTAKSFVQPLFPAMIGWQ